MEKSRKHVRIFLNQFIDSVKLRFRDCRWGSTPSLVGGEWCACCTRCNFSCYF